MGGQHFEPGRTVVTPGRTIGEGDIHLFAGLVGDFTPVHVDESFARTTPFGGRIAHGPLAMSTAIGMLTQTGWLGERVVGLLNLNWDFKAPVRIGDTIRSRVRVESARASSTPGRGVVVFDFDVVNQAETLVQHGRMTVLVNSGFEAERQA